MISILLSLYAAGALTLGDTPANSPQTMPWSNQPVLEATSIPQKEAMEIAPVIKAKAAIAVDLNNGLILYEKNIQEPLPIASLTKLMTAVIILEENNLKDVVQVSKKAAQTEGSKIWLAPGENITVENLLYGVMIPSANDAAAALSEYNAGDKEKFAEKMNNRAHELGLTATSFVNPTGLIESPAVTAQNPPTGPGGGTQENTTLENSTQESAGSLQDAGQSTLQQTQANGGNTGENGDSLSQILNLGQKKDQQLQNFSSAYDLTVLARYAYGKSFIRRAAVKKEMEITSVDGKIKHQLKNTNELLGSYLTVLGLKTGTTDEAGECLIAIVENDQGHDILTVVLNSPNRYNETKLLADWVFRAYKWN